MSNRRAYIQWVGVGYEREKDVVLCNKGAYSQLGAKRETEIRECLGAKQGGELSPGKSIVCAVERKT